METVNLKDEFDGIEGVDYEQINMRLLAVAQMQTTCDVLMAEVEDILNAKGKYKYDIKRNHKNIVGKIKEQYADIYKIFNAQQRDDFIVDNQRLQDFIKIWVGLNPKKEAFIRDKISDIPYTMSVNPVGDIFIRNKEGWVISIPKAIAGASIETSLYNKAKEGSVKVNAQITISQIKKGEA